MLLSRSCLQLLHAQANLFAEKLDSLMEVVLAQLEGGIEQGQGPALWAVLLPVFQRTVLRTHRCKFAQYLLWYLCLKVRFSTRGFPLVACCKHAPAHVTCRVLNL